MAGPGPRALQKSWSMNLGQHAVQILTARFTESIAASQSDIVVLGERSLFALKPQGQLALQKILDANPSCACTYPTSNGAATCTSGEGPAIQEADACWEVGSKHNLIIGTHAKSLSVFRGSELIWAAKTKDVPIAVAVATFAGISGLIVVLFQSGEIQICYLGTVPRQQWHPPDDSRLSVCRTGPAGNVEAGDRRQGRRLRRHRRRVSFPAKVHSSCSDQLRRALVWFVRRPADVGLVQASWRWTQPIT